MSASPSVLHEARLVAIDKPPGVLSEDAARAHGLRLVHRLDKDTSGLLLLAEDARTVQRVQRLLRARGVTRRYLFLAHGDVVSADIESVLVRDRGDGLRGSAREGASAGKRARTLVTARAVAADRSATLAEAVLDTGRTHQVRIHLAERGHPLVGERVYVRDDKASGRALLPAPRVMLHAWRLAFVHPNTRAPVALEAALPKDFVESARALLGDAWRSAEREVSSRTGAW